MLSKLWLNRNNITTIEPLEKLTKLKVIGLFHNEIFNDTRTLDILEGLTQLHKNCQLMETL
jgi:Leucine-rich repeat (LRR) protein